MQSTLLRKFLSCLPRGLPTITLQRSIEMVTTPSGLIVRKLNNTDNAIMHRLNREFVALGWKYGAEDLQCYLDSSYPGISIAELDGDLVGCIALHKVTDSYFTGGLFFVLEKYKGTGCGLSLVETALKEIDCSPNSPIFSGYSSLEMTKKYEQVHGTEPRWFVTKYALNLSTAFEVLKTMPSNKGLLTVREIDHIDEGALLDYDATVFGYPRYKFFSSWLHSKGNLVKVVVNNNRDIVGYVVARPAYMKEDGYCIRPLFADSIEAAQVLLTGLFEEIIRDGLSSSDAAYIDCPNINASIGLMRLLHGKSISRYVFMSAKDIPKGQFVKWFGRP